MVRGKFLISDELPDLGKNLIPGKRHLFPVAIVVLAPLFERCAQNFTELSSEFALLSGVRDVRLNTDRQLFLNLLSCPLFHCFNSGRVGQCGLRQPHPRRWDR